jgi:pimeloyl-ACP methyl ester carboxylesterase
MANWLTLTRNISLASALLLLIGYVGISLVVYVQQTRMLFFPSPTLETTPKSFNLAYEDVWLKVGQGAQTAQIHGWWIPVTSASQGVVLYLHGNGANIGANVAQAARFHQLGLSVFLIDYRGYGRSDGGFPNETKVYQDAERAWAYLVEERKVTPQQILLYGHSLGGAIAIQLAVHHPDAAGLIVQSSFTAIRDMVYRTTPFGFLPVDWILTQKFDSLAKVTQIKMPVLFIHGTADREVPADMSQTLYQAAPNPKELWLVPDAAHNNVADTAGRKYLQVVGDFVRRLELD